MGNGEKRPFPIRLFAQKARGVMTKINATKSAIEFADENQIDLDLVDGTGADGRIGIGDVRQFADDNLMEAEEEGVGVEEIDPSTAVTVRLVGAQTAVLNGKSILRDESHRVTYRAYCRARDNHPNKFAVKFGDMPDYRILG